MDDWCSFMSPSLCLLFFFIKMMIFPMHVGDRFVRDPSSITRETFLYSAGLFECSSWKKHCYASNVLSVLFAGEFVLYLLFQMYIISASLSFL